jgi:hypothetical protein
MVSEFLYVKHFKFMGMVFWVVTQCNSEKVQHFGRTQRQPAEAGGEHDSAGSFMLYLLSTARTSNLKLTTN